MHKTKLTPESKLGKIHNSSLSLFLYIMYFPSKPILPDFDPALFNAQIDHFDKTPLNEKGNWHICDAEKPCGNFKSCMVTLYHGLQCCYKAESLWIEGKFV